MIFRNALPLSRFILLLTLLNLCLSPSPIYATQDNSVPAPDLILAQEAIADDDLARAEKLLLQILNKDTTNAVALRLLGIVQLKNGARNDAIASFTTALKIDPLDELTREYLFSLYFNHAQELLDTPKNAPLARAELLRAIEIRPESVLSYYFLGILSSQEERYAETITALIRISDRIPDNLKQNLNSLLYNSAIKLLTQQKPAEASVVIPYFAQKPQATAMELILAATIALETKDYESAIILYDRALKLAPNDVTALHNRSIAQERLAALQRLQQQQSGQALVKAASATNLPTFKVQQDKPVNNMSFREPSAVKTME